MAWTAPKTDWASPDGVSYIHLNNIGENLVVLKAHVDATTGVHGAVSTATVNTLVIRDADGRAKVAAPAAVDDIAILSTVTAHSTRTDNPHSTTKTHVGLGSVANVEQMPKAGGTFIGQAIGLSPDTDYTKAMLRNIKLVTSVPAVEDLENGEIAFVYEV
jgi:RNase P/RNase MRP subunit p29